jgi:hypothetical protein
MRIWNILPLVFLLAGCGSSPSTQDAVPSMMQTASFPAEEPTIQAPTLTPIQAETPTPAVLSNGPFTLTVFSPLDQASISEPSVEIHGEVSEDAVLSINDDIYVLPPGVFTETVVLEEGPNAIQIVASDMNGNEVDLILTVIYLP